MIKTLKGANNAPAKVGNIQIQPQVDSQAAALSQNAQPTSLQQPVALAPQDTPLKQTSTMGPTTVATLVNAVASNVVVPSFQSLMNSVLTSTAKTTAEAHSNISPQEMFAVTKRFEPFEQLTGISHERPEIIALTNFVPLYEDSHTSSKREMLHTDQHELMTSAGKFFDFQTQLRLMKRFVMMKSIQQVRATSKIMNATVLNRVNTFNTKLDDLQSCVAFLFSVVQGLEKLKAQFDLRNDLFVINPEEVLRAHIMNFVHSNGPIRASLANVAYASTHARVAAPMGLSSVPSTFDVNDVLEQMGFIRDNVKHKFSSTKIWMQLLWEMKSVLLNHSLQFLDIDPAMYRGDENASALARVFNKRFGFRSDIPNVPTLDSMSTVQVDQVVPLAVTLAQVFRTLYEDINFKNDESRIAALAHVVSKEFRYSNGLASLDVQQTLTQYYGFAVRLVGNANLFDNVIGLPGNDISDIPTIGGSSLVDIAQQQVDQTTGVLTFEEKYIDSDLGTLTPGGVYYVDQTLQTDGDHFDTTKLDALGAQLDRVSKSFNIIVSGMNLLMLENHDPNSVSSAAYEYKLANPRALFLDISSMMVDVTMGTVVPVVSDDRMSAIFVAAAQSSDNVLKTLLFMYMICKVANLQVDNNMYDLGSLVSGTASAENTPSINTIASLMLDALDVTTPEASTSFTSIPSSGQQSYFTALGDTISPISRDALLASLQQGTPLLTLVESLLSKIVSAFRNNNEAFSGTKSRFGGYADTVVIMAAFDLIVNIVAKYSSQKFTAKSVVGGITYYNVSNIAANFQASISEIESRLNREIGFTQQMLYAVMNTLNKLRNSIVGMVNFLNGPTSIDKLREISGIIGDKTLLRMMLNEQQIMLLTATAADIKDQATSTPASNVRSLLLENDNINTDADVKFLDDGVISTNYKNALLGFFKRSEFAESRAYNKKIITVGIPLGFTRRLKQRVDIRDRKQQAFADKQSDIVNVSIYKIDLQNSDIVYKPQKFLFELSRFPVRNSTLCPDISTPDIEINADFFGEFPTRDYSQVFENCSGNPIQYGVPRGTQSEALAGESYGFITRDQKDEIIRNHVISMFLETYVKVMTNMNLAEHQFDTVSPEPFIEADFTRQLLDSHMTNLAMQSSMTTAAVGQSAATSGVFFSHLDNTMRLSLSSVGNQESQSQNTQFHTESPTTKAMTQQSAQQRVKSSNVSLNSISRASMPAAVHQAMNIAGCASVLSTISMPSAASRWLIRPRKFDRVFNVSIDPDEFEVDYEKTVNTPYGKEALDQMISDGTIVSADDNEIMRLKTPNGHAGDVHPAFFVKNRNLRNNVSFKYRDRDKNSGDMTFDKYFVVIETFGEEDV